MKNKKNTYQFYHSALYKMLEDKPPYEWVLNDKNIKYSINDITRNSVNIAKNLTDKGFKEGDKVVIISEPGIDFISTLYALILLKGITSIIDPDMGSELYQNRLKQFDPKWIFIDYRLVLLQYHPFMRWLYKTMVKQAFYIPHIKSVKRIVMGKSLRWHGLRLNIKILKNKNNGHENWCKPKKSEPFLVTYTSGTLDEPKGVLHLDNSLGKSLELLSLKIGKYTGMNMVSHLPHFALLGIQANVKVMLWKKELSPEKRVEFINKNNINIFFGPPVEINELLNYCEKTRTPFPQNLKYILLGSAPIYIPFLQRLQKHTVANVECLYGMTENLLVSSINLEEKMKYDGVGDIVGKPIDGVSIRISPENEILISSNQLFDRYWHLSERVEKYHPTGDLGFVDAQGRIVLTGRKKNMIIRKEHNIYPGLYEPIINKIPEVYQAVMMGKYNDNKADEDIYLIVETKNSISEKHLLELLNNGEYSIDNSAMPDYVIFSNIPRKGRQQKIDYKELKKLVQ